MSKLLFKHQAHLMLAHIVLGDASPMQGIPRLAVMTGGPPDLSECQNHHVQPCTLTDVMTCIIMCTH